MGRQSQKKAFSSDMMKTQKDSGFLKEDKLKFVGT